MLSSANPSHHPPKKCYIFHLRVVFLLHSVIIEKLQCLTIIPFCYYLTIDKVTNMSVTNAIHCTLHTGTYTKHFMYVQ